MMDKIAKIVGWVLLTAGVLMIVWTLYASYNIFTGKAVILEIFQSATEESQAPAAQGKIPTSPADIQEEMGKMIREQLQGFLPTDTLPKLLNLAVWSMLAFILIFGGTQLSGLGIKLLRK